jgi:hypothetical protein
MSTQAKKASQLGVVNLQSSPAESALFSIFEPGVSNNIFIILNLSLIALFLCLTISAIMGYASIHVYVLLMFCVGLFISVNWFKLVDTENSATNSTPQHTSSTQSESAEAADSSSDDDVAEELVDQNNNIRPPSHQRKRSKKVD